MRIAIPSKSGADVAYSPLHAPKVAIYSVDEKDNREAPTVIDMPDDKDEKLKVITDSYEVFLSRDGNRDFLIDMGRGLWSLHKLMTRTQRPWSGASSNGKRGRSRPAPAHAEGEPCLRKKT